MRRSFYEIKEILKRTFGIPTDRFLAEDLGIKYNNLRNRVIRDSVPFSEILDFCHVRGVNPNEIIYKEAKNA